MKTEHISRPVHSTVVISGSMKLYFDPYKQREEPHDADLILVTHDHYDHYDPESIRHVMNEETLLVMPYSTRELAVKDGLPEDRIVAMKPGQYIPYGEVKIEAVPMYNVNKKFHARKKDWLGFVVTLDGVRYYVSGDTDDQSEGRAVQCDVALVPVGGTYTMTAAEAAAFVNAMGPKTAIPTHYGDIVGSRADAEEFVSLLREGIEGVILD